MQKNSILFALSFSLLLSACATPDPVSRVEVRTVPVARPAPIVPNIDPLELRETEWIVVTEQNIEGVMLMLRDSGQEPVLFALTAEGYQNIELNQSDIFSTIRQYQSVIAIYERSYFEQCC